MMEGGGDLPSIPPSPPMNGDTTTEQVTPELATPGKHNISGGISSGNRGGSSVETGAEGVLPASDGGHVVFDNPPLLPYEEVATVAVVPPGMGADNGKGGGEAQPEVFQQTEKNVSHKYTLEEVMARHWGMSMEQVKRVKALLRLGVDEDDLPVANKLLKLGRPTSDAPLAKEEQLLGYTSSQRQIMKALHTLGLTEESFERCRALMLSSLGPTAFGTDVDKAAENAARAAEEEGWTPSTKTPRWYSHSIPEVNGLLRPKSFHYDHSSTAGAIHGGASLPRRASEPEERLRLPEIHAGKLLSHPQKMGATSVGEDGAAKGSAKLPLSARTVPG